jgi:hypothetical protein
MSILILIVLLAAVVGSSMLVFTLTYLFMRSRNDRLTGGSGPAFDTLQEQVRRLTEELDGANAQIEGLRERMDFTERLLGDGRGEGSEGAADSG